MVVIAKKPKFDPAAHLHKHGWKGKGTALKHGHSIKPLSVVQKKTLSGIGKDRDEAVPFWDHIFAATAASLFSSTSSSSPSNLQTSSKWAPPPIIADEKGKIISNQQPIKIKPKLSINATARAGRELARRGLYSRFLRGKVLHIKEEDVTDQSGINTPKEVEEVEEIIAGPSKLPKIDRELIESSKEQKDKGTGKGKGKEEESKEERRARKAEKKRLKDEKIKSKQSSDYENVNINEEIKSNLKSNKKDKKRKKKDNENENENENDVENEEKSDKKRKIKSISQVELNVNNDDIDLAKHKEGKRIKKAKN
ncbi:uncharacterized protein I206_105046 [Kwoniella pini CBS 10737]|uniref:G-patch domain-containing protein n=1 Tax=Kwoniella pini CBS 10737 TaxID=1296096 RepID=A0A1B9I8N1_9TREE|nr:uncharacterized protein I206_02586 [Kwoniella pini CBS 10737]OCF51870.1 hypothetical protein I206_02586 [Kwoniella pini CBS 10737]